MLSDDKTTLTDILKEQIETYRQRDELKESCQILTQQLHQVSCERNDLQAELLTLRAENERLRGAWVEGEPTTTGWHWADFDGMSCRLCYVKPNGYSVVWDSDHAPECTRDSRDITRHAALTPPPTKE